MDSNTMTNDMKEKFEKLAASAEHYDTNTVWITVDDADLDINRALATLAQLALDGKLDPPSRGKAETKKK